MSFTKNRYGIKLSTYRPRNAAIRGCFRTCSIFIFVALFITSCVSYQKLPSDWASTGTSSGDKCPQIAGKYNNIGEDANKDEQHLVMLFFEKESSRDRALRDSLLYRTTHISFQQKDQDSLSIIAWRDKEMLCSKTLSLKAGDFKCEDGWLIFNSTILLAGGLVMTKNWQTIRVSRSGDYLLVKMEEIGVGIIFLVPAAGSDTAWMRFPAVESAGARELQAKKLYLTNKEIRSPRLSPDGKEIVFTLHSNTSSSIYKVDVNGTNLTVLSKPGDYDAEPAYSPDGKTIAFTSFQHDWQGDICLMKSDGSGKVCLTTGAEQDFNPIFSPDGSKIYFIRALSDDKDMPMAMSAWQEHDIYSVNVDGTGLTRITRMQSLGLADLSMSPDGKRLLARITTSEKTSIWIIPLKNPENMEPVQPILDKCESSYFLLRDPYWCNPPDLRKPMFAPDGRSLLFVWKASSIENLFVMDLETRKVKNITDWKNSPVLIDPSFSHDGSKIVFSTLYRFFTDSPGLWTMNTDGSNLLAIEL